MRAGLQVLREKLWFEKMILIAKLSSKTDKYNLKNENLIIMQVAKHGNLGDQAIALAQRKYLEENFPKSNIIEVPLEDTINKIKDIQEIKDKIKKEDIIFIHGGGNLGDLYIREELIRRYIIKKFPDNKIILFPQTIYFSDTEYGRLELIESKKIYNKHKYLTITARERKSFEIMKKEFPNTNIILTPDIVLSLNEVQNLERKGIMTCLRSDNEKYITDDQKEKIFSILNQYYNEFTKVDTIIKGDVEFQKREEILKNFWKSISSSEVVITDRLHGMIFCAITQTPCIVLKNSNYKIEETYKEWLKDLEYIKLIDIKEIENLFDIIEELKSLNNKPKKINPNTTKFQKLKKAISV